MILNPESTINRAVKLSFFRRLFTPHILSMALSVVLLAFALALLFIGHWFPVQMKEKIVLRELALTMPPLPPPPPPVMQPRVEPILSVTVQGQGVSIPKIKVVHKLQAIKPDMPVIDSRPNEWASLEVDWQAFDLEHLDTLPKLLSPLKVNFPKSLSRQGVRRVLVRLDVVIDEQGRLTLVDIIENPHPELLSELEQLVRTTRFSAPLKDDQAVRARFIWPVLIES